MLGVTQLAGFGAGAAAGGGGGPSFENMVWNSADKAAGITLFDGDKEAWHQSNTNEYVRATKAMSTGKWCWALHVDAATLQAGIALSTYSLDTGTPGTGTDNVRISQAGVVSYNGSTLADYTDYVAGDYVLVAFDADAGDIWFGRNTTWNGDPAAGTGAVKSDVASDTWYPFFGCTGVGPQGKVTLVPFPTTVPTGFTALQPTPSGDAKHWETVHFQVVNSSNGGWNGFDLRMVLTAAQLLDKTGSKVRARLKGGSGENAQVSASHFGHQAGAGDAYDMDGTQVALNFSGSNAYTINAGALTQSDDITYAFDGTKGLVFAFHFNNASHDTIGSLIVSGYTQYHKSTAAETGTSDVTGYTSGANTLRFVQEVQVYVDD